MTLEELRDKILECDPAATRYEGRGEGNYTVWQEVRRLKFSADNGKQGGWDCQIDRWTKQENDPVAEKLAKMLDKSDCIAWGCRVTYDKESGYIRHIFTVQAA